MADDPPPDVSALHRALMGAEGGLEPRVARLWARLGLDQPRCLVPYRSFGTVAGLEVRGRLLASDTPGPSQVADRWWHHVGQTYQRWNTREVPGVEVRLRFGEHEVVAITDEEGDYEAILPAVPPGPSLAWCDVHATAEGVEAVHRVLVPGNDAERLVLSDVDDTVLHTGATSALRMAWHSFGKSARYRTALPGIAALYTALATGPDGGAPRNPLAFVSSSPRNLYDLLEDFFALHGVPDAPILLRDVGLDATKILKTQGHGHKLDRIEEVMARYPHLPVVLLGDTGQHDAVLYAEAVGRHGARIQAVYLRDVDPERDTPRDLEADGHGKAILASGVPYVRGVSIDFAEHALGMGWVSTAQRDEVAAASW